MRWQQRSVRRPIDSDSVTAEHGTQDALSSARDQFEQRDVTPRSACGTDQDVRDAIDLGQSRRRPPTAIWHGQITQRLGTPLAAVRV